MDSSVTEPPSESSISARTSRRRLDPVSAASRVACPSLANPGTNGATSPSAKGAATSSKSMSATSDRSGASRSTPPPETLLPGLSSVTDGTDKRPSRSSRESARSARYPSGAPGGRNATRRLSTRPASSWSTETSRTARSSRATDHGSTSGSQPPRRILPPRSVPRPTTIFQAEPGPDSDSPEEKPSKHPRKSRDGATRASSRTTRDRLSRGAKR